MKATRTMVVVERVKNFFCRRKVDTLLAFFRRARSRRRNRATTAARYPVPGMWLPLYAWELTPDSSG
jgi:hypothetical protein